MASIRVLIVEDEGLFRNMLGIALATQRHLELVGAASNGHEAIRLAEELEPDVVLMDIELGSEPNGIQAGHRIRALRPSTGIVILSTYQDKQYIAALPADQASGWSYLLKQNVGDVSTLTRAIEGSAAGLVVMDPVVIQGLRPRPNTTVGRLTPRQREVLELITQGYNNAGIAQKLVITQKSVENTINAIFQELGITRSEPINPRVKAVLTYLEETRAT